MYPKFRTNKNFKLTQKNYQCCTHNKQNTYFESVAMVHGHDPVLRRGQLLSNVKTVLVNYSCVVLETAFLFESLLLSLLCD